MNMRERVLTLLGGGRPDRVPWFADLDYYTTGLIRRGERPRDFKTSAAYIDWHRSLGAGFYLQGYMPFRETHLVCAVEHERKGNERRRRIVTPIGELTETWRWSDGTYSEAPVERLVKSEKDLPAYRAWFEDASFEPDYDLARFRAQLVKDIGVVLCYTPRSPLMHLTAVDAGIENIITAYMNAPEELEETFRVMRKAFDRAVEIVAASPAEIVMIPENLSSEVIGVSFFENYMRDTQSDWVQRIHDAGKYSCMHLDGTLRGLLRREASVGFTFIEAMTPAPVGDMAVEEWLEHLGTPGPVAWGGIPGAYFSPMTSEDEFEAFVVRVLSVMRTQPRYVLGVADQVPPDGLESRVRRVAALVEEHGRY